MTIEIGFAYIDLPKIGRVSIVDVPGHEKLVHNMLVGAMGIDLALLCVAADEGVMPQTREHLQILELLPVERMIVALTRSDLAGYGGSEPAKLAVQDLLARTRFENSPILPVSAMTGVGIDVLLAAIEASLSSPEPEVSRGIWRLPIDRVFSVKGFGCVVTGTLSGGEVKVGDEGAVEPGGIAARVRLIHSHDVPVEAGEPGRRIALNISGPKAEDLHRGQMIGAPGSIFSTQALDAEVRWLERPKHATRVRLSIGAEEAIGKVFLSDGSEDAVQLRLEREVACYKGQPIIIRRYSPPELLGGGQVKIPLAKPRRKSEATSVVSGGTFEDQVRAVLHSHPLGIQTEEICRMLGQSPQSLGNVFERLSASGSALGFAGLWFGEQEWKAAANRFVTALERMHEKNPMKAYLPREAVVAGEKLPWAGKQLDRMIGALAAESKVSVNGTQVKSTGFHVSLNPKQRAFLDRIKGELDKGAVNPPPPGNWPTRSTSHNRRLRRC